MRRLLSLAAPLLAGLVGCTSVSGNTHPGQVDKTDQAFTSVHSVLLDFEFDGQLVATTANQNQLRNLIRAQLMYTVGSLNADNSVGRFERLELTDIVATGGAGHYDVTYHARLPVAWGRLGLEPATYTFLLPARAADADLDTFAATYNGGPCVVSDGRGANRWTMWYYYRPLKAGCAFDPADIMTLTATVTTSVENTAGQYPEYDKVWADNQLNVVAMFGRAVDGATSNNDAGIYEYNSFVRQIRQYARSLQPDPTLIEETPGISNTPGVALPQVSVSVTLPPDPGADPAALPRQIHVNVMLVGYRLYQDGTTLDDWYNPLTPTADMILYNGHAGLGENVRNLSTKGDFVAGQYLMYLSNGCDTFAYVDSTMGDKISAVNGGAPSTLYLDTITNAMSGSFSALANGSMTLIRGLTDIENPRSYQELFVNIDRAQVVLVTGEEDNLFQPGMPILPVPVVDPPEDPPVDPPIDPGDPP